MADSSSLKTKEEILPYQFEPRLGLDESDSSWETVEDVAEESDVEENLKNEGRNDVEADVWCTCNNCQRKYLAIECVCCKELDETLKLLNSEEIGCIIEHKSFEAVCLNKDVIWTALVNLADREDVYLPPRDNVPNRTYRYGAYRQFTWWIHNRLGRHVRRIIPSCAISRIRAEFEEESGEYTVFKGEDDIASEIVKAFEWTKIEDKTQ